MKSRLYLSFMILVLTGQLFAQKIGFNINTPVHPVHVVQPTGTTLLGGQPLFYAEYTGTNLADMIGMKVKSKPADYYGIGGDFEGGYTGVRGRITGGLDQDYYGVKGDVTGTGSGDFYSLYGYAHSSGNNYAVYGNASGGIQNWAGYFGNGNVHIDNRLTIGTSTPSYIVHITQPTGTVLTSAFPLMHVEYTGTNSDNVIAIRAKSALPGSHGIGGDFQGGQMGISGSVTTTDQGNHTGVSGFVSSTNGTNIAIYGFVAGNGPTDYSGYFGNGMVYVEDDLGVGRKPETNRLEVNGNASKSSAGDWLANSDARLKKNIKPLDAKEMIEKLLVLQGITYEWNDDTTGNDRPTGIQYGFTAQNIQEVFPTLVEEDAKGYLQTAYGTYDAMMIEALRYLYMENQSLKNALVNQSVKNDLEIQSLKSELEEIRNLIKGK